RRPISIIFPYTTLFRSPHLQNAGSCRNPACRESTDGRRERWLQQSDRRPGGATPRQGRRLGLRQQSEGHVAEGPRPWREVGRLQDRKSTRLNSSHVAIS